MDLNHQKSTSKRSSEVSLSPVTVKIDLQRYRELYDLGKKRTETATEMGRYVPTIAGFKSDAHNDARAFVAEVLSFEATVREFRERYRQARGEADALKVPSKDESEVLDGDFERKIISPPESRDGPDAGFDYRVGGVTFDCKFTEHQNGMLLFRNIRKFKADAAILVTGNPADELEFNVVGGIMRERWYKEVCTMSLGSKVGRIAWVVKQEKLTPIPKVAEWLVNQLTKRNYPHT